jgi:hypothetical protein
MRDFRDAKVMAHALRDALKVKIVETTHSECLELIAKAFGYENWNILSAKIDAAQSREPNGRAPSRSAADDPATQTTLYCSFCGKSQHEVRKLIAGPTVFICDECVSLCDDIIDNEDDQEILRLLKADEENGNLAHPAAFEHFRGMSTEDVELCVARRRRAAKHHRLALNWIRQKLAKGDGEELAEGDILASPRFAHLKNKSREDLLAFRDQAERDLTRDEDALRIGETVLRERGRQVE